MNDLLDFVLDAHGGLERWSGISTLTAKLDVGGPIWGQLGFPDAFLDETLTIDTRRQHAVFTPWTAPGRSLTFDTDPERVVLQTADGQTIDSLSSPASSYAGNGPNSPWDALQVGYFLSYGMWNYLTTPFLLTYPGVHTREIAPWQENDQTWRRLHATFPASLTTHSPEQVFYFGDDGLLRRLDYTVEADGGRAAHYTEAYKTFDGLAFPTRRRVYRRTPDGTPRPQPDRHHPRHPRHHRRLTALRRKVPIAKPTPGRAARVGASSTSSRRPPTTSSYANLAATPLTGRRSTTSCGAGASTRSSSAARSPTSACTTPPPAPPCAGTTSWFALLQERRHQDGGGDPQPAGLSRQTNLSHRPTASAR